MGATAESFHYTFNEGGGGKEKEAKATPLFKSFMGQVGGRVGVIG